MIGGMPSPQSSLDSQPLFSKIKLDLPIGEFLSLAHLKCHLSPQTVTICSEEARGDVLLSVAWEPAWVHEQQLWISHLPAGEERVLHLPEPEFDAAALRQLEAARAGRVRVSLRTGGETAEPCASQLFDFTWLPAMDWRSTEEYPELAASLVLPGDPAVESLLGKLRSRLGMQPDAPWPGYAESPSGVLLRLRALWEELQPLTTDVAPESFSVRTPSEMLRQGIPGGRDAALLLVACMARMQLAPVLLVAPGGALPAAVLTPAVLPLPAEAQVDTLLRLIEQGDIVAPDTELLRRGADFDAAVAAGARALRKADEVELIDLESAWQSDLAPIEGERPAPRADLSSRSGEDEGCLISSKAASRVERWQRKLLDLSLRNSLLNTKLSSKNQLELIVPSVAKLEDMLASGATFRIAPLPDKLPERAGNDAASPEAQAEAEGLFRKRTLLANAKTEALPRLLKGLYDSSRREMEESGANTLFIGGGFLQWVPQGAASPLLAPLLLLPVQLNRTSVRDGFTLSTMDEEAQVNQTLLELLKTEFGIRIPELEGDLPKDDSGLDVPLIFEAITRAIATQPGWAVLDMCAIGIFSFAKFLMWRDLCERQTMLKENAVVRQLAAEDRGRFPDQVGFPELSALDHEVDAHKVYTPLPSDSSQLAAILAAARGKSFVLEGPPGTGKSQTIANMIAHCLGHGKTVLFVAEKAVALEVVYKRLARIGLGNFCLELHSNKTQLSAVMRQFREAVEGVSRKPEPDEWDESVDSMTELREQLNSLPRVMHAPYPDGATLYRAIAQEAQLQGKKLPLLPHEDPLGSTEARRKELLALARDLAIYFKAIMGEPLGIAPELRHDSYSHDWEEQLADLLQQLAAAADRREEVQRELALVLGVEPEAQMQPRIFAAAVELAARYPGTSWEALLPSRAGRVLLALDRILPHAEAYRALRASLSLDYPAEALRSPELAPRLAACRRAENSGWISRWWSRRCARKLLRKLAGNQGEPNTPADLEALVRMQEEAAAAEAAGASAPLPEFLQKGVELTQQDTDTAKRAIEAFASEPDGVESFACSLLALSSRMVDDLRAARVLSAWRELMQQLDTLAERISALTGAPCRLLTHDSPAGHARLWLSQRGKWRDITLWNQLTARARAAHAGSLAEALTAGDLRPQELEAATAAALDRLKLRSADTNEPLRSFTPPIHQERIHHFADQEARLRAKTGAHIRKLLAARAAGISHFDRESAILQREISKKRLYKPLRKLLAETPHITPLLKPCFLMSPLSVAQYLTTTTPPFDVVIFDEASQIPVWDAIGAIARGKSVIITGDSHQMPPTSFFSRSRADEETEDDTEPELESILDECLACGVPKLDLTWHYRSKSETLISFSNAHYYEGKMTTFPAPALRDTALSLHYTGGLYEPGASRRVNPTEARAVVQHVVEALRRPGFRYTEATSIGIVTFNTQQQKLISDLLEEERAKDPALEPFFAETNPEAVFVKNLENVQGDERGVIYFSTTFGRDAAGRMSMNFGPLNLTGGERRLNVAVTRARYAMHIFTSMHPEDINLSRTRARGVADLRAFLEYARGGEAFAAATATPERRDALAIHIATCLEAQGWRCRTGLGASDYRVDIAIEHPDLPNAVLAGITIDGPAYRAAHTARDRDVVRPDTMRLLGWRMLNLWSIAWWRNPEACLHELHNTLELYRQAGPPQETPLPDLISAAAQPEVSPAPAAAAPAAGSKAAMSPGPEYPLYTPAKAVPGLFRMADTTLERLITALLRAEAPMARPLLLQRLEELSPFKTSQNTREFRDQYTELELRVHRILHNMRTQGLLRRHEEETLDGAEMQEVLTLPGHATISPRAAGPRPLELIPLSELGEIARLVQAELCCIPGSDAHVRGMKDFLGLGRLTPTIKNRLLFAIQNHAASTQSAIVAEE